jgi:hypothetical protein
LSGAAPREGAALSCLVLFFARFLAGTLASKRGFYTLLLAGLQVKGVALDLLDNVFLLHLTLKTAQSVLEGFALLKPYFCQLTHPQTRPVGPISYYKDLTLSQEEAVEISTQDSTKPAGSF